MTFPNKKKKKKNLAYSDHISCKLYNKKIHVLDIFINTAKKKKKYTFIFR